MQGKNVISDVYGQVLAL